AEVPARFAIADQALSRLDTVNPDLLLVNELVFRELVLLELGRAVRDSVARRRTRRSFDFGGGAVFAQDDTHRGWHQRNAGVPRFARNDTSRRATVRNDNKGALLNGNASGCGPTARVEESVE